MKKPLLALLLLFSAAFLILLAVMPRVEVSPAPVSAAVLPETKTAPEGYLILNEDSGEIFEIEREKFIAMTVALEMSPDAPMEALKAQAVAARSYYDSLKLKYIQEDYHFTYKEGVVYASDNYFRELWGEDYDSNKERINSAVKATENMVLEYDGEVACCAYFPLSSGVTADGESYPYLISVASPYDSLSPYFEERLSFTPDEVMSICKSTWPEGRFNFDLPYENWFSNIVYSTGTVVYSTDICGFGVTGEELREAFGLKSSAFKVEFTEGEFLISCRGIGHGVGMSQYGAIQMAAMGAEFTEILAWYYPGTKIK